MKAKYILATGIAVSAAVTVFGICTAIGGESKPAAGIPASEAAEKDPHNGSIYSRADGKTYQTKLGDYRISFDFPAEMEPYDPRKIGGIVSQDYYSQDWDFITITVVPAKWNVDEDRPRNAKDYAAYRKATQSGDILSEKVDAEDYRDGEYYGIKYWDVTEYSFGKAYVMGYDVFHGDDYMYIFVQRSDHMPEDITNLRIEKIE